MRIFPFASFPIEAKIFGSRTDTPLEARVLNAGTLLMGLLCLLSAYVYLPIVKPLQFSILLAGAAVAGTFYALSRFKSRWRSLALPCCTIFLLFLAADWLVDPEGLNSNDIYYLFVLLTGSSIILTRRVYLYFAHLIFSLLTIFFATAYFHVPGMHTSRLLQHSSIPGIFLTITLCLLAIAIMLRLLLQDHKRSINSLRRAERESRLLLKSAPAGIYEVDLLGKKFLSVNDTLCRLIGYTRKELLSVPPQSLLDAHSREALQQRIGRVLADEMVDFPVEMRACTKDGQWVDFQAEATFVSADKNRPERVLVVAHDITVQKKTEEALRRHTTELANANSDLEAFSYSVSHDLRNPLHTILACSEVIGQAIPPESQDAQKALYHVEEAANRMSAVITDLMVLSRISGQDMLREEVDMSELASSIQKQLREDAPARDVEFSVEPGILANADARLVRILLENLLGNSWKYTSRRPCALITFGRKTRTEYFVSDNGAGFDMADASRLFQPFQRLHTRKDFPGTGIGLTIVRRIVERHGGRVWAEAVVDKSATFHFSLGEEKAKEAGDA